MNSSDISDSQAHAASSDHAAPAPATLLSMLALLAMGALCLLAPREALAQADKPAAGLDLQHARAQFVEAKGKKVFYAKRWDLSDLPSYGPKQKVSGTIRMWGSNYIVDGNVGKYWEEDFRKFQPGVKFDYHMKTTIAAVPALVFGVGDIGVGRKITFAELLLYQRYNDRDPLEITVATGSYDVTGWQPGYGIVVNRDNPVTQLTLQQLDGIFGSQRLGGWEGTSWHPEYARGPEGNIRTWGQLGAKGEWADKPINVYGLNLRYHQATEISDRLLKASDKWNEQLRIYANFVTPDGKLGRSLTDDLAKDRFGIAYIAAPTRNLPPELKIVALARTPAGPYVPYTIETVHGRTYPLFDEIYTYVDQADDRSIDPKVKEFLRFVVSREGQEAVQRDGKYLPLTAEVAREQLRKLDGAAPMARASE
ncbi:MAG: phosphate ABC transporter substrate-binding protein [Gammaproteobacteria bacterium]|nr:MAG: phosphate ABC transporter substrate-binding protein [Gammaproteobacteria bacterium]